MGWSPWNWSDGWFETPYGSWELNLGPLQEQQMLLTPEPLLQQSQSQSLSLSVKLYGLSSFRFIIELNRKS